MTVINYMQSVYFTERLEKKAHNSLFHPMVFLSIACRYCQVIKHAVAIHLASLRMMTWRPVNRVDTSAMSYHQNINTK